ncbi:ciliary-associated calcium-binding coiled-coil protein 1 isoform X2 [Triplophysa rosa]|uniref:ciliary-associated calcium-binding coiled-coil protein 1 isoform X2 n=1 Tax=Triplophysa rosa TaxID=992332 RepID=UPI002545E1E2|nr:ciliary-associated calcium-binding coiled-coil protein 1 isoform X2 [Triplophysa rosa]
MITCLTHRYLANSDNNMSARERSSSRETSQKDNLQLSEMKMPFSQWELLDHDQLNMMLDVPVDQVQLQFKDILDFKNHQTCVKDAALLDYFVNGFCWAREMNFTCQQISCIMALLQHLLYNIKNNQTSFADDFKVFTEIMNVSSPSAETDTSGLFNADQIRSITRYVRISVFQHYRLYEWLFSQQRQKQLFTTEKCIEVVNPVDFVCPLEEGMSADVFFQHVAPPCVQTPEQCIQDCHEQNGEEVEREEGEEEDRTGFSVEDVREMLEETTREMLAQLQADFTEKLRAHEETYTSRLERLQKV